MAFFKLKPNLPDGEKAKIEFHYQQIADCIGFDRFKLPVWNAEALSDLCGPGKTPDQVINVVGEHLACDVSGLDFVVVPEQPEKCGGGG